jgi:hypothetical protein
MKTTNIVNNIGITFVTDIPEFQAVQLATDNGHRADQRAVVVQNLVPNTSYRFRVRAVNQYGRGPDASRQSGPFILYTDI